MIASTACLGLASAPAGSSGGAFTYEVVLFLVAVVMTLVTAAIIIIAIVRHGNRDSDGRTPSPSDDRDAS